MFSPLPPSRCNTQLGDPGSGFPLCGFDYIRLALPPLNPVAHKMLRGTVGIIGGDQGMAGAPLLAGMAAMAIGAGVVRIYTHAAHAAYADVVYPEMMVMPWAQLADQTAPVSDPAHTAWLVGPGLGRGTWGKPCWEAWMTTPHRLAATAWVADADALFWLAQAPDQDPNRILTPHPGEAARLLQTDIASIQTDRQQAVWALWAQYGGVVVLKGPGSWICDGSIAVQCPLGGPVLATAGSGDVLAGMIAGLCAGGAAPMVAACAGVWLHAMAGDRAQSAKGARSVRAGDLVAALAGVLQNVFTENAWEGSDMFPLGDVPHGDGRNP